MRRAFGGGVCMLAVAAALGCGSDDGAGAPPETALIVTITYTVSDVDTLHATGVALTTHRSFGPFDATGRAVRSGATLAFIFKPSDAGTAMLCVEGRNGTTTRAAGCGMFAIAADQTTSGELHLDSHD